MKIKIQLKICQTLVVLVLIGLPSILLAHGDEDHKNLTNPKGNYLKKISIDGANLTFHITSRDISLTIVGKKSKKKIKNAIVKLKVIAPDKKVEIQKLKLINDQYKSFFSLKKKGVYKAVALIKIGDKKNKVGFQFNIDL